MPTQAEHLISAKQKRTEPSNHLKHQDSNMKVIYGIAILTAKDINAMNARINKAADMAKENEQSVAQQDKALIRFSGKFATAMDFIGRNLPLKRKRKAFRKIVEA